MFENHLLKSNEMFQQDTMLENSFLQESLNLHQNHIKSTNNSNIYDLSNICNNDKILNIFQKKQHNKDEKQKPRHRDYRINNKIRRNELLQELSCVTKTHGTINSKTPDL